jgi:D-arabinose 1-dehydrogenase-like Zn-dependent alcohol dehydrogenase
MMKLDWNFFLLLLLTGSDEKLKKCLELGADVAINYRTEDFVARVKEETGSKGACCSHINLLRFQCRLIMHF